MDITKINDFELFESKFITPNGPDTKSGSLFMSDYKDLKNQAQHIMELVDRSSMEEIDSLLVLHCEQLTLDMRTIIEKRELLMNYSFNKSYIDQNFLFNSDEYGIHIQLQRLLPKLSTSIKSTYLWSTYYNTLVQYRDTNWNNNYIRPDNKQTIIFVHYENLNRKRDYDNYDIKNMTDVLTAVFLKDDSQKYVESYHTSIQSDENKTAIHIIPSDKFIDFYPLIKSFEFN